MYFFFYLLVQIKARSKIKGNSLSVVYPGVYCIYFSANIGEATSMREIRIKRTTTVWTTDSQISSKKRV